MSRRPHSRGQSMVELAVVLPVLAALFLGSWTAADLIADNNTAQQAARAGARLGAELGDNGYVSGGSTDPSTVDKEIIQQMVPVFTGKMPNASVTEIDIYEASACTNGGTYSSGTCPSSSGGTSYCCGDPVDKYLYSGGVWSLSGSSGYTLDLRSQTHPNEAEIGVRIVYTYTSPTLRMFNWTGLTQYTVMRLAPVE